MKSLQDGSLRGRISAPNGLCFFAAAAMALGLFPGRGQIGYLFLDEALGEYAMETRVGFVEFQPQSLRYFEHSRPLVELPAQIRSLWGPKGELILLVALSECSCCWHSLQNGCP
jgi:hypothetical protein